MREELVGAALDRLLARDEHEHVAERLLRPGEHEMVEVGQRHDQANVVQRHEVAERRDVAGVVDPRDDGVAVGVVERRGERVDVGRDRRRTGTAERA